MRTIPLKSAVLISLLFSSCVTPVYYQVYKATPVSKLSANSQTIDYEDDKCRVTYNLWQKNGNFGFWFINKSDQPLFLHLEQCFFVKNGVAYNYYKHRTFTSSTTNTVTSGRSSRYASAIAFSENAGQLISNGVQTTRTTGAATASEYAVTYQEERMVCIPPKTSRYFFEYTINEQLYRDCELFRYPLKRQIKTKSFSQAESPFVFSNRLAYSAGDTSTIVTFENAFFISSITNYPEREITEYTAEEFCRQKSYNNTLQLKGAAPDKFYIQYLKTDTWKH